VLPGFVPPQLATPASRAPTGDGWIHEIKLDGYRMACRIAGDDVRFLSRRELDWTADLPELAGAARRLGGEAPPRPLAAYLDGEVAFRAPDGRTRFGALQNALAGGAREGLTYFAFDLLHLGGESLAELPLIERKARLAELFAGAPAETLGRMSAVTHVLGQGPAVLESARRLGLEGIVSKRLDQPSRSGRGTGWLKIKCKRRQEFVVAGFTARNDRAASSRAAAAGQVRVGALLCGYHDHAGRLCCAGRVGSGFSDRDLELLAVQLRALQADRSPFDGGIPPEVARGAHWVQPKLVAEVEFTEWTDDGQVRHGVFLGLRSDKPAKDVRREPDDGGRAGDEAHDEAHDDG
jgi:bifunctional non-homologous end joining protein LigD